MRVFVVIIGSFCAWDYSSYNGAVRAQSEVENWCEDETPPTNAPTTAPTTAPTAAPTTAPTNAPSSAPTAAPPTAPTADPTANPTTDAPGGSIGPVDCGDASPWEAKNYDFEIKHVVHYEHMKYAQQYWVAASDLPGRAAGWGDAVGTCKPGTEGTGPTGPLIDCSSFIPWAGQDTYATEKGFKVHSEGKGYTNKYWTSGDKPGQAEVWELLGSCEPGTDIGGSTGDYISPTKEAQLCSCCKGCAKSEVTGPMCLDDKTEETCYYSWCPKYNTYDVDQCEVVKAGGFLKYYEGELMEGLKVWPKQVYVPYFDSGLATYPPLTKISKEMGVNHFIAAFIVQSSNPGIPGCHGAWAGYYPVQQGPVTWNQEKQKEDYLFAELNDLRKAGGDVIVSFGGAVNVELADSKQCQQGDVVANLVTAYSEVIDFVKLTHIDFDIEGMAYSSIQRETGWKYRFAAVKELEAKYPYLKVWWTLPILPAGLTLDGMNFLSDLMESGVRLDSMNVMTMDYGDSTVCPGDLMGPCEIDAITNLADQMFKTAKDLNLLTRFGWTTVEHVYPMIGSIPMLGMNDVTTEIYTLEDAKNSISEWKKKPIGVVSNWSLNRDQPCPAQTYVGVDCSSFTGQTESFEYAKIFTAHTSE